MAVLEDEIRSNEKHENSNCFALAIICHGNNKGRLLDVEKRYAWDTEQLIGDLSRVDTLVGKPKILIFQCCRGGKEMRIHYAQIYSTAEKIFQITSLLLCPDIKKLEWRLSFPNWKDVPVG